MVYKAKSKSELDEGGDRFPPLPADTYLMSVQSIEVKVSPNPYDKTEEHPEGTPRDQAVTTFKPIEFANGDALLDWEDNDVPPDKTVRGYFDLSRLGFSKTGPSKSRKFLAAITGSDIEDEIEVGEWSEYFGKKLMVTLDLTTLQTTGRKVNRITDVRGTRKRGNRKTEATDTPVVAETKPDPVSLLAKAEEVFGEGGF
jgi:hypothetical protein